MTSLTRGNTRGARCSMVILDVFPMILQDLMKDSGTPPDALYKKIMNTKPFREKLNQTEMQTVQSLLTDGFANLDVSLIYKIVKYFKIYIPQPSRQWGANPQPNEIEIGDDVERIRLARNSLLHRPKAHISEQEMNDFFVKFINVGRRIDHHLNKPMTVGYEQMLRNLESIPLDADMAEQYLQALQETECLKEKCKVEARGKEIHILSGNLMDSYLDTVRSLEAESEVPAKIIIHGIKEREEQITMLEELQGEINTENIHFRNATKECIVLYVLMKCKILQLNTWLNEVEKFIGNIFKLIIFEFRVDEEVTVIVAPCEDDFSMKNVTVYSEQDNKTDCWGGGSSLVLNVDIRKNVFDTPESFKDNVEEFFENLLRKTNGRQLLKQNEVTVIMTPGEHDVDVSQRNFRISEELTDSTEKNQSSLSAEITYETSVESTCLIEKNTTGIALLDDSETNRKEENEESKYAMAQSHVSPKAYADTKYEMAQSHISPKAYGDPECHVSPQEMKPWKLFVGFRRLIELKDKDATEITSTFYKHKIYLKEALNSRELEGNKEMIILLLRCIAVCCTCKSFPTETSVIFRIMANSAFLGGPLVQFINNIVYASEIERENYYKQSVRDLIDILIELNSQSVWSGGSQAALLSLKKKSHLLKDLLDEDMKHKLGVCVEIEKQLQGKEISSTSPEFDSEDQFLSLPYESTGENVTRKESSLQRKTKSDPSLLTKTGYSPTGKPWRLQFGFNKLLKLKDEECETIIMTFDGQRDVLKQALDDDENISKTDMVSLFLRCFSKCCDCDNLTDQKRNIFSILKESLFLKNHVHIFVNQLAIGDKGIRKIKVKQSLEDILTVFDHFNFIIPEAVSFIHGILLEMDTALNAIRTQTKFMDDTMWGKYHALMDRKIAVRSLKQD